jgi:hypothetical protein
MTTIVTRSGKGSPLTHTEVDTNFTNLNTAKLETAAIPLGTLQAPSVSFLNDSDTGIFCPQGGNSLAIATGGQYAITCSSTQAVGIKTANPQGALQVAGSTRIGANDATDAFLEIGEGATGNRNSYIDIVGDTTYTDYGLRVIRNNTGANATSELKHRGTGALNFTTEEAAPIVFYTTNSPALTITSGGLVGIGTSSPGELLQVGGFSGSNGITIGAGSSNYSFIYLADGTGGTEAYRGYLQYDHATDKLELGSAGATAVTVDSLQRVGIGSASPGGKLHVKNGASGVASPNSQFDVISAENDTSCVINIFSPAANEGQIQFSDETRGRGNIAYSHPNDALYFSTAGAEKVRIDSSGRMLVGTTTDTNNARLQEKLALVTIGSGNIGGMAITNYGGTSAGSRPLLDFQRSRGTTDGSFTAVASGDQLGSIIFRGADGSQFVDAAFINCEVDGTPGANDMPGRLVFSTTADEASSPTERMRITSYGTFLASNAGSYPTTTGTYHAFSANSPDDLILRLNNTSSTNPYGVNVVFDAAAPNDTTRFFLNCADNAALRATIRSNGGLANYSANNANLSDRNVKKDISPAANTWNCIKEWEIVNYRYKDQPDDADLNLGVIAQQVAESCPEVITIFQEAKEATEDKPAQEERLGVKEQQMYWMAIKALQEAMGRIEQLETKVAALESA